MNSKTVGPLPVNAGTLSNRELWKTLLSDASELIKAEVTLAKSELRRDLKQEATMAAGLGAGALLAYAGIILLFVAGALGLATVMPGWAAALVVAGLLLAAAGASAAIGWARRVRTPLERTRREAQATLLLAKERIR
jgi:predicted phage tail protein